MSVFDLHVHTVRGSSDSSFQPEQLVEGARALGLDGVCVTEHGGGWEAQEFQRVFREAGITVVRGLEVETDMGHIIVFGLHRYVTGMHRAAELRKTVDAAGGVMISAHPFRNLFNRPPYNENLIFRGLNGRPSNAAEASSHPLFQLVDDVEVANGSNTVEENSFSLDVAGRLGFAGTGGSDAHSAHGLGRYVTLFDQDVKSEADLLRALKAKAFAPGELTNGAARPLYAG